MFKPTFGQTNTTSGFGAFTGAANANPFVQTSVFGKTTNTGFAPPAFGASGSTSLFSNTLSSTGSFFGASTSTPTFGQAQTTQPSFGFGTTPQPSNNLFSTPQNTGTGLFGSGSTSAFGANKPPFGSTFGTGTSTGLFGAQQPTQTSTSLFGQSTPATGTGLFGASTGTFGASNQQTGTVIKFNPVTGTDNLMKNGISQTVSTRHFCITCMKEYESKSLEELRLEDYMVNRKGPQQSNLFGTPTQQPTLFGATSGTPNLFGTPQTTENKTLFGQTNTTMGGFGPSTSNVFGSTPTATNTLFGNKPSFGTTTTTTPAFGFGSTTSSNLFGNTQNKSFGATPQTGMFGQTTTQQPTAFGTNTGFTGFNTPQNQTIGLFGNKPATTFNLNTTTTSTFTFGSNTATSTGFFGSKPATTEFGTTPATGGFGTGFGTSNTFGTSTATSSSAFKPTTTNFSFGNMQNTGTLGTGTLGNTGSLFGNNAQKPGGLFGNTTSTGLFGSSFGNTTNTFGTTNLSLGTSTGGSSLFANNSMMPSQPASSATHPAILALASVPFADSPLFKNLLPASGKTDSLLKPSNAVTQKAMLACKDLKVSPKNSVKIKLKPLATPLTKKSLFEGLEETDVVSPSFTTTSNVKKLTLKPKAFSNGAASESWAESTSNKENQSDKVNPRRVSFTIPTNECNSGEKDSFYIRRNPLFKPQRQNALVDLEQTSLMGNRESGSVETVQQTTEGNKSGGGTPSSSLLLDETVKDSSKHSNSSLEETRCFLSDTSHYDDDWEPHPTRITLKRLDYYTIPTLDELVNLIGDDGSCIVDNFCIGRYGYGNLYFDETMDISGLNIDEIVHFRHKEVNVYPDDDKKPGVGKELNRKCQVTLEQVWPIDKTTREPIKDPERLLKLKYEEKLRRSTAKMGATFIEYRPATGSWVFKVDHFSKYGLTDSDDEDAVVVDENKLPPGISTKLKIPTAPPPTQVAGAVPKFSPNKFPFQSSVVAASKQENVNVLSPILPSHQTFTINNSRSNFMGLAGDHLQDKTHYSESELGLDIDEDMDDEDAGDGYDLLRNFDIATEHLSPSVHLARRTGIDSHRVQLMKASLFEEDKDDEFGEVGKFDGVQVMDYTNLGEMHEEPLDTLKLSRGLHAFKSRFKMQQTYSKPVTHFDTRMDIALPEMPVTSQYSQNIPVLRPRPKTVNVMYSRTVIPFSKSSLSEYSTRCASDSGVFKGRSFKNGWGPCSSLMTLTTLWNVDNLQDNFSNLGGRAVSDNSPTAVQRLYLFNNSDRRFKEVIKGHLMIQLENSNKGDDGCPLMTPQPGVSALHAHCLLACKEDSENAFELYCRQVWELCVALWGNLPALSVDDNPLSHKTLMMRKEAVTEWSKKCAARTIRKEVEGADSSSEKNKHVKAVLSLLSGKEIEEACARLQKSGDHFAALLLTSGPSSKPFLQNQLSEWQNVGADVFIDEKKLELFCLSSGLPLLSSAKGIVNICDGLDWKRAFAVHFWYLLSSVSTIGDAIKKYENAFDGPEAYAERPNPPYGEVVTSSGRHIYDLCYHLIKLYCFKSHPLEQLLNPATYTSDPLDHRLSWFLEQVLSSLGYTHVSKMSSAINCVSFAAQLEAHGLWHWSVFVYLHIPDSSRRKQAVLDMINRHVTLTENQDLTPEELFVVEELDIPAEWIYRGKATLALSLFRYHDSTHYLIQAREWNEAHKIIIKHIAADAVINENYDYLRNLLESLVPNAASISEWFYLGQLLWDYLEVNRVVQQALAEQNIYELERGQAQISSVCARIVRWPCPTVKDRLCQSEIAKKMAHIYRNVMQLQGRMTQAEVTEVISKLPLPEDYLMEELRHIKEVFPVN